MFLFFVSYHLRLSGNFYGSKIQHGIFLGFVGNPRDFFGIDFCPHSITPVTWNPEYPPGFKVAGYSTVQPKQSKLSSVESFRELLGKVSTPEVS